MSVIKARAVTDRSGLDTLMLRCVAVYAAVLWSSGSALALDIQPERGSGWLHKGAVHATHFMVTAAHPLAAQTGYDVLKRGGTVADAAVAVQLVLNLVEPQSSGIGGGAFALHFDARTGALSSYDGRETAPAAATPAYFLDETGAPRDWWGAVTGGGSVGIPGTLKLLDVLHAEHGRLPWRDLVAPALGLADRGFEVSPRLASAIANARQHGLDKFPSTWSYFAGPDGEPLSAGARLRNPEFATTLRLIGEHRSDVFYHGPIAADIVAAVRSTPDNPGILSVADFADYQVKRRDPVCINYRGHRVCGMGPPSSGALTVGQILGILNHFDLPGLGYGADAVHLFAEAGRLAYADRGRYMADGDFVRMPLAGLLDPGYLMLRAQPIRLDAVLPEALPGNPPWTAPIRYAADNREERPGTSHFSIVDRAGNALSITTTIETGFGSRLMTGGFLLNNELTDFSFEPERNGRPVANRVEGGKRPRSSMAPTIVFDAAGDPLLLIGSPGGSRIINYVARVLIAVLDWGMGIQQAIDQGHFGSRGGPVDLEQNTDAVTLQAALESRGHQVNVRDLNSGLHGIAFTPSGLEGGADPRREGVVMGD